MSERLTGRQDKTTGERDRENDIKGNRGECQSPSMQMRKRNKEITRQRGVCEWDDSLKIFSCHTAGSQSLELLK